jgi:hypothetical protein
VPDYAFLVSSLVKTQIPYSLAIKWVNDNARSINSFLNQYNSDSSFGLILVLTQWSAPGYSRIVVPSNHTEHGIVMGLSNGTTWVEGESPEGKAGTLSIIEHYSVLNSISLRSPSNAVSQKEQEPTLFVDGLSIKKASVWRRVGRTVGLCCSSEPEWRKYLSVKKIERGGLTSLYTFEN